MERYNFNDIQPISQGGTGATTPKGAREALELGELAVLDIVPVTSGGTGATTVAAARKALGLGEVATEDVLPITKGGTGANTAKNVRKNLGFNTRIDVAVDLNTLTAQDVLYHCSNSSVIAGCANCPTTKSFVLEVLPISSDDNDWDVYVQRLTEQDTVKTYVRQFYKNGNHWTDWKVIMADEGKSLSENGYQKLSNGLCIQWGLAYDTPVVYPIPFSQVFTVVAVGTSGGADENLNVSEIYSTEFRWGYWKTRGACRWLAIGIARGV